MKSDNDATQPRLQGFEQLDTTRRERCTTGDAGAHRAARSPNADLVGRMFCDGSSQVIVKGLSMTNPAHVVVEREHDGHTWTIHAGIVRLIVGRSPRRRAA